MKLTGNLWCYCFTSWCIRVVSWFKSQKCISQPYQIILYQVRTFRCTPCLQENGEQCIFSRKVIRMIKLASRPWRHLQVNELLGASFADNLSVSLHKCPTRFSTLTLGKLALKNLKNIQLFCYAFMGARRRRLRSRYAIVLLPALWDHWWVWQLYCQFMSTFKSSLLWLLMWFLSMFDSLKLWSDCSRA